MLVGTGGGSGEYSQRAWRVPTACFGVSTTCLGSTGSGRENTGSVFKESSQRVFVDFQHVFGLFETKFWAGLQDACKI